jgi:4-amino-4-deoxy-L-arabinose transferase-like glycosyltransferase
VGVQMRGPFFYVPVVFSDSLPWSLVLPAAAAAGIGAWRAGLMAAEHRIRTLLLLWIGVTVLFFSLSQTKQDLYIFHIVPAVAALGATWIATSLEGGDVVQRRWLRATLVALALVLVAIGGFVLYLFGGASVYEIEGARLIGAIAAVGAVVIAALAWRGAAAMAVAAALTTFVAFNWILLLRALPAFEQYKPVVPLADIIRREAGPDDVVMHFDVALPSMVFYLQRHVDVSFDVEQLHRQITSDRRVFAVLPAHRYPQLKTELGVPTCELARRRTGDIRLRNLLALEPPPEVVLITNRCGSPSPDAMRR